MGHRNIPITRERRGSTENPRKSHLSSIEVYFQISWRIRNINDEASKPTLKRVMIVPFWEGNRFDKCIKENTIGGPPIPIKKYPGRKASNPPAGSLKAN